MLDRQSDGVTALLPVADHRLQLLIDAVRGGRLAAPRAQRLRAAHDSLLVPLLCGAGAVRQAAQPQRPAVVQHAQALGVLQEALPATGRLVSVDHRGVEPELLFHAGGGRQRLRQRNFEHIVDCRQYMPRCAREFFSRLMLNKSYTASTPDTSLCKFRNSSHVALKMERKA